MAHLGLSRRRDTSSDCIISKSESVSVQLSSVPQSVLPSVQLSDIVGSTETVRSNVPWRHCLLIHGAKLHRLERPLEVETGRPRRRSVLESNSVIFCEINEKGFCNCLGMPPTIYLFHLGNAEVGSSAVHFQ